jgi:hypothetical protein
MRRRRSTTRLNEIGSYLDACAPAYRPLAECRDLVRDAHQRGARGMRRHGNGGATRYGGSPRVAGEGACLALGRRGEIARWSRYGSTPSTADGPRYLVLRGVRRWRGRAANDGCGYT